MEEPTYIFQMFAKDSLPLSTTRVAQDPTARQAAGLLYTHTKHFRVFKADGSISKQDGEAARAAFPRSITVTLSSAVAFL
jgi:hypothetical protein